MVTVSFCITFEIRSHLNLEKILIPSSFSRVQASIFCLTFYCYWLSKLKKNWKYNTFSFNLRVRNTREEHISLVSVIKILFELSSSPSSFINLTSSSTTPNSYHFSDSSIAHVPCLVRWITHSIPKINPDHLPLNLCSNNSFTSFVFICRCIASSH